jgi:hypothetical protein
MSMQSVGFKMKAGEQVISAMVEHIFATEQMMAKSASSNPMFAQRMMQECPQFPLYLPLPPMPPAPMEPPVAGKKPPQGQQGQQGPQGAMPPAMPMPPPEVV